MKKVCAIILLALLMLSTIVTVYAHSGGTDGQGGHYNSSTGEYHYHHGYSAHQHEGGECPYDLSDYTETSDSGSDWMYWLIGVMALTICIGIWIIREKNKELKRCYKDLSSYGAEIERVKKSAKESEERAIAPYVERVRELDSEVKSLKKKISETNAELLRSKKLVANLENAPKGVSFAENGMPIFYKENEDKPYGDYTVYFSSRSNIYHIDRFCAAFGSVKTHIFNVIEYGRPCKKCADGFFDFEVVPEWFTRY